MKSFKAVLVCLVFGAAVFSGVAQAQFFGFGGTSSQQSNSYTGSDYGTSEARKVQKVLIGTVEDVRIVNISSQGRTGQVVGAGVGAALGGLAGQAVGAGTGRTAATVVLATLGGLIGNAVGEKAAVTDRKSVEVVVTLTRGDTIAVTQELDSDAASLKPGDRVRLMQVGSNTRVARLGGLVEGPAQPTVTPIPAPAEPAAATASPVGWASF